MKTKIAMLISTAGVLAAGSAAALVNTHVLGGSATSQRLVVASSPTTQPTVSTAVIVTTPTTPTSVGVSPPSNSTVSTPPTVASGSQAAYAIGSAGSVTLDTAGDVLTIVGVAPNDGWTVTKSENDGATDIEVRFESGSVDVEFHANLLFGVVTTSVESHDASVTANSVADSSGSGQGGDGGSDDDSGRGGDDSGSGHGGGGGDD